MIIIKEGILNRNSLILIRAIARLYLLILLRDEATAQPTGNTDTFRLYTSFDPSMSILVVVLVCVLFLIGFFSIYIRQCADSQAASSVAQNSSRGGENNRSGVLQGLDHAAIESFPVFAYSFVRDFKVGKGVLECAVCLSEFVDDEMLRLLPECNHVFHSDCIDAWLGYHVTCPVCRADLAGVNYAGHVTTTGTETLPQQSPDYSNLDLNDEERREPTVMNNHFTNQVVININDDQISKEVEPNHEVTTKENVCAEHVTATARETLLHQSPDYSNLDSNDEESREPTIMNNHFTNQVVININDDQISKEVEPNHEVTTKENVCAEHVTTTARETLLHQSTHSNLDLNDEESREPTVMNNHFMNRVEFNINDDQIRKEAEPNHEVTTKENICTEHVTTTARATLQRQSPQSNPGSNDEENRVTTIVSNQFVINMDDDQIRKGAEPNYEVTTKQNKSVQHVIIITTATEALPQQSSNSNLDSNDEGNRDCTTMDNHFTNEVVIHINDDQISKEAESNNEFTTKQYNRVLRSRACRKCPRSHSMGHSMVQLGETKRYTLLLPDDVTKRIFGNGGELIRTVSDVVLDAEDRCHSRGTCYVNRLVCSMAHHMFEESVRLNHGWLMERGTRLM